MANNNDKKVLNVPALRFPEFTKEWKKCTIKDYGEVITGNTPPTKNIEYYSNGSYLWASPADLGLSKHITSTKTKLSLLGLKKTRTIPQGSILVTCIGSTIGKMGMATETMSTNQQINSVIVNDSTNNDFAYYAILNAFPRYLSEVGVQAVPILSKSNFEKLPNHTTTKEEQRKLGYFLNLLDERIATQNKIIEDLKKLKSAIYQELFSNLQGEEKSLSELAEITKGQQVNGNQLSENGKYYVMNGGIMPSGYYDDYNTEAGTISISEGGNSCGYVQYNKSKFWSGGHCYTLHIKPTARISTLFLFHCLKWKEEDIMALRIGSGLPNIQKKDLSKVRIIVPTFDKQQQLIALLSTLQMKIEYEEMYTINLDKQKLHLLSQMFI